MPLTFREQGVDDFILEHFGVEAPAPDLSSWRSRSSAPTRAHAHGADRARRQVRAARGRLPVGLRSAASRGLAPGRPRGDRLDRLRAARGLGRPEARRTRRRRASWLDGGARRHPDPRRLRRARHRGQDPRRAGRARAARSPTSASASACRSPWPSSPGTWPAWTAPTRPSSTSRRRYPVIDLLPEQKEVADLGGTMRLGADPIKLHDGTRAREIYGEAVIYERHRHRYEVNNLLRKRLQSAGLRVSGTSPDERLVEVDRARRSTRSSSPPSSTPSSSRAPSVRRRCSATSSRAALATRGEPSDGASARRRRGDAADAPASAPAAVTRSALARGAALERALPEQDLRRAVPDREPVRARAGLRRARDRRAARARARRSRRTTPARRPARTAATCSRGSRAAPGARGARGDDAGAAVRAPGHGAAAGAGRAGAASTASGRTRTRRSSAPTTRPRSR